MKKTMLVLGVLLGYASTFSQNTSIFVDENIIIWSEKRLLTWNDFKKVKKKQRDAPKKAISTIGLNFVPVYSLNKTCAFEVVSFFDKKTSRTATKRSESLLNHEQYHFNIAELLARKFRAHQTTLDKEQRNKKDYDRMIDWYKKVYHAYQENYDRATRHGADLKHQKNWEKKIDAELQTLKKYQLY